MSRVDTSCDWTYDQWKEAGYQVRKGEKSTGRNEFGKATFSFDQVDEDQEYDFDNGEYEDNWMFIDPDMGDRW